MNIVFFAHFAGSLKHGMVYGHYYLAREWIRAGHNVTIITASYAHTRSCQPKQTKQVAEEYIDGIRYIWIPTPSYSAASKFGRMSNIVSFSFRSWRAAGSILHADMVICSSHHPFAIFAARRLSRQVSALLVFEVRDLWPLTLIELGGVSPHNPFIWLMQKSENYAYRHADYVVSVLKGTRDYMIGKGMAAHKFIFIPNGVDLEAKHHTEQLPTAYRDKLLAAKQKGKFIVGYAGRIGLANSLHTLLDAVSLCDDKNIYLAILGDGSHKAELREQAQRLAINDQVFFFSTVSKAQAFDFLQLIDVAYIGLQSHPVFRFGVSPTKLNDYMLAKKPIIHAIQSCDDIVSRSGAGVSCPSENPEALCKVILSLKDLSPEKRERMGRNGYSWIKKHRDYKLLAKKFLEGVSLPMS